MSKNTNLSFLTDYITADITNGRIGINNASPTVAFDVSGATRISGALTLTSTISNGTYTYTLPSATGTLALTSALSGTTNYIPKFTSSSAIGNSIIFDNGTSIGIGTTSPVVELQVGKASDVTIALSNSSSVTTGNRGSIAWYNSSVSTVANIRAVAITDNVGTQLEFYTRPAAGSLTQVLTITSAGNVGIGTSSPDQQLTIGGFTTIQMTLRSSTTTGSGEIYFGDSDSVNRGFIGYFHNGDYMQFNTAGSERMRILSGGNVGIGTTSPSYPLDVNGIIGVKNIIRLNASSTTSVSTTATVISTGTNTYGGLAIVWGDTTGGTAFSDLIFYAGGSISVLSGINTIGGPAGRTYSMSGTSLRVAMGAGTYTIRYQALLTT